jgi:endogenous inhibitor of DNA gyrase (YacG/DUF329 family)
MDQTTTLGACPQCETPIKQYDVLIEYETVDGPSQYAECPDCVTVVTPTQSSHANV